MESASVGTVSHPDAIFLRELLDSVEVKKATTDEQRHKWTAGR